MRLIIDDVVHLRNPELMEYTVQLTNKCDPLSFMSNMHRVGSYILG